MPPRKRAAAAAPSTEAVLSARGASARAVDVVARGLGVDAFRGRPFASLSQGQQKLALVAGAVASRPDVLVLDEAAAGLDASNRARVLAVAAALHDRLTLVYVTHHADEHLPCLTHVLHLQRGAPPAFCGPRRGWDPS